MSDQTDSGSGARTTEGTQPQPDSQPQDDSKTKQGNSLAGSALVDAVMADKEASEALRKHFQSSKDRGVSAANKNAQQALDEVQRLANKLGVSGDQLASARRELLIDDLYQERYGDNSQRDAGGQTGAEAQGSASSGQPVPIETVKAAFSELDFNDNDVLRALSAHSTNKKDLYAALGEIKEKKASRPKASPTMAPQPGGGEPVKAQSDLDALRQEYNEKMKQIQPGATRAITQLQVEYRRKGLDI